MHAVFDVEWMGCRIGSVGLRVVSEEREVVCTSPNQVSSLLRECVCDRNVFEFQ